MSVARRVTASSPAAVRAALAPVVVSLDDAGGLLDVVGDLRRFLAGDGDGDEAELLQRLQDLRFGAQGAPELLQAVELAPDRYADVHILDEGDSHHFVLHDVSELMRSVRRSQQASHELALQEQRQRRELRRKNPVQAQLADSLREFRRGGALLDEMVQGMRAPLVLLSGHARLLEQRFRNDPAALRSIAAIQHAAVRLDAIATNGLIGLGGLSALSAMPGALQLTQLAGLLEQTFALQAQARGVAFKVQVAAERDKRGDLLVVDDIALRQLLLNLVIHALDGIDAGTLNVALAHKPGALEIEIAHAPNGFAADRFGALLTTSELLHSDPQASFSLAVSQQLLHDLNGEVELVACRDGGHALWLRLPTQAARPDAGAVQ